MFATTTQRTASETTKPATRPSHGNQARAVPIGNQAVLRRRPQTNLHVQPKLQIGAANDSLEQEADQVADQVMRRPDPAGLRLTAAPIVSRKCAACEKEDAGATVQPKAAGPALPTGEAPPSVHRVLVSAGQPLGTATRAFMEPRFGVDLSGVRVHADALAADSARQVGALGYTVGSHIAFATGRYAPGTPDGDRLLAHELTHVVQQSGGTGYPSASGSSRNFPSKCR
jgi:hypothetical protein